MRTAVKFTLAAFAIVAVAGGIAACADAKATETGKDADLTRDLELASAATLALAGRGIDSANLALLETKPQSAPEEAPVVKRGSGKKAVRSAVPTVRAQPDDVAAAELAEGEALAESPAVDESEPVAVVPVPAPIPVATAPAGDYGSGGGIFGPGDGRIGGGGGPGVVIRGGGVDGDNCELHRRPRGNRGPIYVPVIPTSTRPTTTASGPSRGGVSIGSRNPGTVSRRPGTASASPRPSGGASRPGRVDPRGSRRGL